MPINVASPRSFSVAAKVPVSRLVATRLNAIGGVDNLKRLNAEANKLAELDVTHDHLSELDPSVIFDEAKHLEQGSSLEQ